MGTISDKLDYLAATKAAIKSAIIEKGQTVEDSDTFRSYAEKIAAISTGGEIERLDVTENGTYSESGVSYSPVVVNVQPDLDTLDVSSNGTYTAPSGTGYSPVYVNVEATQITGTMPDGNEYIIEKDPTTGEYITDSTTGEIVQTKVPSAIDIITEPTKKTYEDGETIVTTGMVIKLYNGDGTLFTDNAYPDSILPNNYVTLNPTKSKYPSQSEFDSGVAKYTGGTYTPLNNGQVIVYSNKFSGNYWRWLVVNIADSSRVRALLLKNSSNNEYYLLITSESPFKYGYQKLSYQSNNNAEDYTDANNNANSVLIDGKIYYSGYVNLNNDSDITNGILAEGEEKIIVVSVSNPSSREYGNNMSEIAVAFTYGDYSVDPEYKQTITVTWDSTYNHKKLTDSFEITVTEASEEPEEEPENE